MPIEHYKEVSNRRWLLVFYHNFNKTEDLFKNKSEAILTNQENKYSILGKIKPSFRIKGRYEFLLEYPKFEGYFNHWSQTKNPVLAKPNEDNGYKPINISWTDNGWHGLAVSSSSCTFIDGSPLRDDWFYSIGLMCNWNNAIPSYIEIGPMSAEEKEKYRTKQVKLWIRIPSEQSKCHRRDTFAHSYLFVALVITKML